MTAPARTFARPRRDLFSAARAPPRRAAAQSLKLTSVREIADLDRPHCADAAVQAGPRRGHEPAAQRALGRRFGRIARRSGTGAGHCSWRPGGRRVAAGLPLLAAAHRRGSRTGLLRRQRARARGRRQRAGPARAPRRARAARHLAAGRRAAGADTGEVRAAQRASRVIPRDHVSAAAA